MELSSPDRKKLSRELSELKKQKKSTLKRFLLFQEIELFSPKLKKVLYFFQNKLFLYFRRLDKPKKQEIFIFQEMEVSSPNIKKVLKIFLKNFSVFSFLH